MSLKETGLPHSSDRGEFVAIDHVQLAMPAGQEAVARSFFTGALGMQEIPKPSQLAKRGGCWFQSGKVQIHLGVEADFHPARKAHPALLCRNYLALIERLTRQGVSCEEVNDIPGVRRCHAAAIGTANNSCVTSTG